MAHPIPDDILIDHLAVLAKTGAGKTYLAKGIVERLLQQKRRVCIIDPKNAWWGLKSSADGKSPVRWNVGLESPWLAVAFGVQIRSKASAVT